MASWCAFVREKYRTEPLVIISKAPLCLTTWAVRFLPTNSPSNFPSRDGNRQGTYLPAVTWHFTVLRATPYSNRFNANS